MGRDYPALDLTWAVRPDDDALERSLALIDDDHPLAWEERANGVRVFFSSAVDRGRAAARLTAEDSLIECTPVEVPDENWAQRSQAALGPVTVGRMRITIPGVISGNPEKDSRYLSISIKPSMGFGTGHHGSTRSCLALLQEVQVEGARVLDAGTGSGILALAAWRLGAREILATDVDPDALAAAAENLDANGAAGAIRLEQCDVATGPAPLREAAPFDVILANLTGAWLMRYGAALTEWLAAGGHLIVSGFQADEDEAVAAAITVTGCRAVGRIEDEGWIGRVFTTSPTRSTATSARRRAPSRP